MRHFILLTLPLLAAAQTCELPTARPEEVGLKTESVEALVKAARDASSDGFVILKDGRYVGGYGEHRVTFLYSVTKAVTGMAVGRMFTEGKWKNIDAPIAELLPELKGDPKGAVTVRQLMSHTSGIRDARDEKGMVLKEWNQAKDWVAAAFERPMEGAPGAAYKYNNQGPVLMAAAVERATGERLDKFVARTIFQPLCIESYRWVTRAGHAGAYTGLSLGAMDLAKLGQLVLNRGEWGGARVLSEDWIRQSAFAPSQAVNAHVGLLWFLQMDEKYPLPVQVNHSGDGGQYLILFPNQGVVVARVIGGNAEEGGSREMGNLPQLAYEYLVKGKAGGN